MKKERMAEIQAAIHAVEEKKTINHVYLVGCGASFAVFKPVEFYLNRETEMPTTAITANEFNYATPKSLGEESVVVTCSHSGSTPETVAGHKAGPGEGRAGHLLYGYRGGGRSPGKGSGYLLPL